MTPQHHYENALINLRRAKQAVCQAALDVERAEGDLSLALCWLTELCGQIDNERTFLELRILLNERNLQ